jgi:hypothetical protein
MLERQRRGTDQEQQSDATGDLVDQLQGNAQCQENSEAVCFPVAQDLLRALHSVSAAAEMVSVTVKRLQRKACAGREPKSLAVEFWGDQPR